MLLIDKENTRVGLIIDSGLTYAIDLNKSHHIDQNLVRTNHSAQDTRDKTVLYAGGESKNSTSYNILISRAKERVHLAIPDKRKFLKSIIQMSA